MPTDQAHVARRLLAIATSALLLLGGCESTGEPTVALPRPGVRPGRGDSRPIDPYAPLGSPDSAQRAVGIELLVHARDPQAVKRLTRMLVDPAGAVRATAVEGLRQLDPEPAVVDRVRPLAQDPDPRVRASAVRFLAGHDGEGSIGMFRNAFQNDEDARVRGLSLASLATFEVTGQDLPAVIVLHRQGDEVAAPLRSAVIHYLCRHATRSTEALELLVPLLEHADPGVRGRTARSLARAGYLAATPRLVRAFRSERDPRAAAEMLLAHASLGGTELRDDCLRLLARRRGPWLLQSAAASVLGDLAGDSEEVAIALEEAMLRSSLDPRARQAAAASLGRLGCRAVLERAGEDTSPVVRRMAVLAYPREEDDRALAFARALISDPDPEVVWAAVLVRAKLRDSSAYPELVEGLRTSLPHAADALTTLKEITGGDPDHGLSYDDWRLWLESQGS